MGCVWKAWKKDIWDLPAEFDRTVICTNEGFQMDAAGGTVADGVSIIPAF